MPLLATHRENLRGDLRDIVGLVDNVLAGRDGAREFETGGLLVEDGSQFLLEFYET